MMQGTSQQIFRSIEAVLRRRWSRQSSMVHFTEKKTGTPAAPLEHEQKRPRRVVPSRHSPRARRRARPLPPLPPPPLRRPRREVLAHPEIVATRRRSPPRMNSGDVDEISGDGSTSPDLAAGSRLERFAADARDVFDAHVLSRLDGGDLAMLALVSRSMRDVVFDSPVGDVRDVAAVRRELGRMPNFVGSVGRLAWAKEQRGCPWDARDVHVHREGWERGGREVGEGTRMPVERGDLPPCREWRPPEDAAVGARERRSVGARRLAPMPRYGGHLEVLQWARATGAPWDEETCALRRAKRSPRGAAVGARERPSLSVGRVGLAPMPREAATWRCCSGRARTALRGTRETCAEAAAWRPPGGAAVGARERRSRGTSGLAPKPRMAATWRC